MMSDAAEALSSSVTLRSLRSEQRVFASMRAAGWRTMHSWYYSDHQTGKLREVDIMGRLIWGRSTRSTVLSASLRLLVEVKSIKGFHILFTEADPPRTTNLSHRAWLGDEVYANPSLTSRIASFPLTTDLANKCSKAWERMAYPRGTWVVAPVVPNPVLPPLYSSTFRETNIGGEKELDNSVVWRACQDLRSAITSLKKDFVSEIVEDLALKSDLAVRDQHDPVSAVIEAYGDYITSVEIYHPVVVVDAPLWKVTPESLSPIEWCRFVQLDSFGSWSWWQDIVHSAHFDDYLKSLTSHYFHAYRRTRAKPINIDLLSSTA